MSQETEATILAFILMKNPAKFDEYIYTQTYKHTIHYAQPNHPRQPTRRNSTTEKTQ